MTDSEPLVLRILQALENHMNVLLYGPPGTGKSYLMSRVREEFLKASAVVLDEEADTDFLSVTPSTERPCRLAWWLTFHQSFAYEDFVSGLRTAAGKGFNLEPVQGALLEAAEHARFEDGASLLLVDEINRGNTSRIFGEFITLMEEDKRLLPGGDEGPRTVSVRLPNIPSEGISFNLPECERHSGPVTATQPFRMPHHVFLLATMNSVDRSVAPLDAALRRRFHIIELAPDYDFLVEQFDLEGGPDDWASLVQDSNDLVYWQRMSVRLLHQLNLRIRTLVGDDFQLGHAYLLELPSVETVPELKEALVEVLNNRVVPQVHEMLRGNREALASALRAAAPDEAESYPFRREEIPPELEDVAPAASLRVGQVSLETLEGVVRRLAAIE